MFQLNLINKIFETEIMHGTTWELELELIKSSRTGTRTINRWKLSGSGTITGTIIEGIKVPELELEL